ncbi:MAG: glycosyltransferase [Candidatus Bathyarchaeota archaeon]|nr:glycosyltransferase [Candidatus Bathyarchaeota archaeon]
MKDEPLVSVIIPTSNSERFLERCLKSIWEQSYPNIEVIVVDNRSMDRTREIAEGCGVRIVLCRAGRSRARNVGAGYAKGEFVLFVDSDMELTPNVVRQCIAKVESGFDAIIIPELSVGEGFWAKCRALEKLCYIGDDLIEAARFFQREVFEVVGGYDPQLESGEDWDLSQRISKARYRVGRIGVPIRHHDESLSLRETMLKKHYYGKTLKRYRLKHPKEAKQQLKLIRLAFIRNWRKLTKDPVYALGMLFMKTCEFMSGLSGSI